MQGLRSNLDLPTISTQEPFLPTNHAHGALIPQPNPHLQIELPKGNAAEQLNEVLIHLVPEDLSYRPIGQLSFLSLHFVSLGLGPQAME